MPYVNFRACDGVLKEVGDHYAAQIASPGCDDAVDQAEGGYLNNACGTLIEVETSEEQGRDSYGHWDSSKPARKLPLQVTAEYELFADSSRETHNHPKRQLGRRVRRHCQNDVSFVGKMQRSKPNRKIQECEET